MALLQMQGSLARGGERYSGIQRALNTDRNQHGHYVFPSIQALLELNQKRLTELGRARKCWDAVAQRVTEPGWVKKQC